MSQTSLLRTASIVLDSFTHISEIRSVSVIGYKPYGLLIPLETQENRESVPWLRAGPARGRIPAGARGFSSPDRPNRLWGPSNLLFMVYRSSFLKVSDLAPRLRMSGAVPPCLHGVGRSSLPLPQKHNFKQWTSNCADQLTINLYS